MKIFKAQKMSEEQINVWSKELKPFVDKVVVKDLKLHKNLYA